MNDKPGKVSAENIFEGGWRNYREAAIGENADKEFLDGHKHTFIAGAWMAHAAMVTSFNAMTGPQFVTLLQQLQAELEFYNDENSKPN